MDSGRLPSGQQLRNGTVDITPISICQTLTAPSKVCTSVASPAGNDRGSRNRPRWWTIVRVSHPPRRLRRGVTIYPLWVAILDDRLPPHLLVATLEGSTYRPHAAVDKGDVTSLVAQLAVSGRYGYFPSGALEENSARLRVSYQDLMRHTNMRGSAGQGQRCRR